MPTIVFKDGSTKTVGNMRGVSMRGAVLAGQNLRGVDLTGSDLRDADLTGTDLRGANMTNVLVYSKDLKVAITS
jgi:uncharacterized protein YjbI with pentapeptide repeats